MTSTTKSHLLEFLLHKQIVQGTACKSETFRSLCRTCDIVQLILSESSKSKK